MKHLLLLLLLCLSGAPALRAQDTLGVLTLNIWHNQRDWGTRLDLLTDGIAALDPDVIFLQEVLQNDTLPNQAQTLADRLGFAHVLFSSTDTTGPKRFGNAILSRHAFTETAWRALEPATDYRTAAYARIEVGGKPVRLYVTHLHHEAHARGGGIRAMQLRDLLDFIEATGEGDAPLVLGGDFNAEPEWPELRLLAPFRDLYRHFHDDAGSTFGPAYYGSTPRRIDYLFDLADPRLAPVSTDVVLDVQDADGRWPSDHYGVYGRFLLR